MANIKQPPPFYLDMKLSKFVMCLLCAAMGGIIWGLISDYTADYVDRQSAKGRDTESLEAYVETNEAMLVSSIDSNIVVGGSFVASTNDSLETLQWDTNNPYPLLQIGTTITNDWMQSLQATSLSICIGGWEPGTNELKTIDISFKTGDVTLPEGLSMTDASIEFWKALAKAFPEARRQIIGDTNK